MTTLDFKTKVAYEARIKLLIDESDFIVMPDTVSDVENGLQVDFEEWKKRSMEFLKVDTEDSLEDLLRKVTGIYHEAEDRRFLLTNILESMKVGGKSATLHNILGNFSTLGLGDIARVPPRTGASVPAPQTAELSMPSDEKEVQPSSSEDVPNAVPDGIPDAERTVWARMGRSVRRGVQTLASGLNSVAHSTGEFIFRLLDELRAFIGKIIAVIVGLLKRIATLHPHLGLTVSIGGGIKTPQLEIGVDVTENLDDDIFTMILNNICDKRKY